MEIFRALGEAIEQEWFAANYDEEALPAIAERELRAADLPSKVSAWDVLEWTLTQRELPRQKDVAAKFGQPPVTLYAAPRFHVDVYFWFQGTTAVHQHAFCGAFQVLLGSSIHSWYNFDRRRSVNSFVEVGTLDLKLCELLSVGDVQQIIPGRQYIHSLFHLDQPSATIVVRTDKSPLYLPQYSYFKPSLAVYEFFEHETTTKKLQAVEALIQADHADADRMITDLIKASDFHSTIQLLLKLYRLLSPNSIEQMFDVSARRERFDRFLQIAVERHGQLGKELADVFAYESTAAELIRLRNFVTEPEHRFFMALLLNVEGKDAIYRLIKQRFPEAEPSEKVLDWAFDLGRTRLAGTDGQNALGMPGFDETDLFVLENLLNDKTPEEMRLSIGSEFAAEKAAGVLEELDARVARIRDAVIFRRLLAPKLGRARA